MGNLWISYISTYLKSKIWLLLPFFQPQKIKVMAPSRVKDSHVPDQSFKSGFCKKSLPVL